MVAVISVAALGALVTGAIRPALAATSATHLLNAVACPAAKDCIAVGSSLPAGKATVPLAFRWNGTKWTSLAIPLPAGATSGELLTLSCTSTKYCLALGDDERGTAISVLAEIWNGTKWKAVTGPAPAGPSPAMSGVSCVSTTSCLAVGYTYPASGTAPFTAHWNGTKWSVAKLAIPKGATGASTSTVTCVSASWCQVGLNSYVVQDDTEVSDLPYVDTWNGKAWSAVKLALATGTALPDIDDDTCLTTKECIVVGQSLPATGGWHTEAATFNGKQWAVKTLAGSDVLMYAVTCTAAKSCLSVGTQGSDVYGQGGKPYVESWNGTSWKGAVAPAPTGKHAILYDVACASASYCIAAGGTRTEGATNVGFADLWNGKAWKLTPAP